jgi:hypothetical protein
LDHDRRNDGQITPGWLPAQPVVERDDGVTRWYEATGTAVGVLTFVDDDYELGGRLIEAGQPAPVPMSR